MLMDELFGVGPGELPSEGGPMGLCSAVYVGGVRECGVPVYDSGSTS